MEGREPVDPVLRPIGVVHADPDADVVIQAGDAPVTRGVVEVDPAPLPRARRSRRLRPGLARSILGEITAVRSGREGHPLKDGTLRIMR